MERKVRDFDNERGELCAKLELVGRQSEEFKLQLEARIHLLENENDLRIQSGRQLQSNVKVQEDKLCQVEEEKKRLQIEIEFLHESIEDFKADKIRTGQQV